MANITVVSTTNSVKVEFNDYSTSLNGQQGGTYRKGELKFYRFSDRVVASILGEREWALCYTATTGCFIIDTIDTVAPISNLDLYNKLIALMA